jgi:hypothetical protein
VIRIIVPVGIQQGRAVLPIKPMIYLELPIGTVINLPAEIEAFLISEGMAERTEPRENRKPGSI